MQLFLVHFSNYASIAVPASSEGELFAGHAVGVMVPRIHGYGRIYKNFGKDLRKK